MNLFSKNRRSSRNGERGGAAAELAMTIPFLTVLLVGGIDLGRAWSETIALNHAAQEGAQMGTVSVAATEDYDGIRAAVERSLAFARGISAGEVNIDVERFCRCANGEPVDCVGGNCGINDPTPRAYLRVTIEKEFHTFVDYPAFPHQMTLTSEAFRRAS